MKPSDEDIKEARIKRSSIVTEQALQITQLIEKTPRAELKSTLLGHKFPDNRSLKPDAIKLLLKKAAKLPPETISILKDISLERTIVAPKVNRTREKIGDKTQGITEGGIVRKKAKNDQDKNILKQNKKIMLKNSSKDEGLEGGEVCEYIGSNLANIYLPEASAKFRLYVDKDSQGKTEKISVASTFIDKFQTVHDNWDEQGKDVGDNRLTKDAKGFAQFFAANALIGDYDIHGGNIGAAETPDGTKKWARIDIGRGLSYNVDADWRTRTLKQTHTPKTVELLKERMIQAEPATYKESLFKGADFSLELNQAAQNVNENQTRKVIQLSMKNLKKAYGDDFLKNPNVKKELCYRMGFNPKVKLTERLIEDTVVKNTLDLKNQLKEMALKEAVKVKTNDPQLIDRFEKEIPNYKKTIEKQKEKIEKRKKIENVSEEIYTRDKDKNHLTLDDLEKCKDAEDLYKHIIKNRGLADKMRRKLLGIDKRLSKAETNLIMSTYGVNKNKPTRTR